MQRILISGVMALFLHLAMIAWSPLWKIEPNPVPEKERSITISISHLQPPSKVAEVQSPQKPADIPPPQQVTAPLPPKQVTNPLPPKPVPEKKPAPPVKKPPPSPKKHVKPVPKAPPAPISPKPETKKEIPPSSLDREPEPDMETGSRPVPGETTRETEKNRKEKSVNRPVAKATPAAAKPLGIKKNATPLYKQNPLPPYPRIAKQRGHSGTVQLMVLVNEKGVPENIRIFESSGYTSLDQQAVKTVKSWLFEPGTVDSTPQEMWVKIPITFELKK